MGLTDVPVSVEDEARAVNVLPDCTLAVVFRLPAALADPCPMSLNIFVTAAPHGGRPIGHLPAHLKTHPSASAG
jgi:hypothetical protein